MIPNFKINKPATVVITSVVAGFTYFTIWTAVGHIALIVAIPTIYWLNGHTAGIKSPPGILSVVLLSFGTSIFTPFIVPLGVTFSGYLDGIYRNRFAWNPFQEGLLNAHITVQERAATDFTTAIVISFLIVWLSLQGSIAREITRRTTQAVNERKGIMVFASSLFVIFGIAVAASPNVAGTRQSIGDMLIPGVTVTSFIVGYLLCNLVTSKG